MRAWCGQVDCSSVVRECEAEGGARGRQEAGNGMGTKRHSPGNVCSGEWGRGWGWVGAGWGAGARGVAECPGWGGGVECSRVW